MSQTRVPSGFFDRVVENSETGCCEWIGKRNSKGYGQLRIAGKWFMAHRISWEMWNGPVPDGAQLDHVRDRGCVSRACVNPAHLEVVSCRENLMRGDTQAAHKAAQTHCIHGHAYTPDNTGINKRNGTRYCKKCKVIRNRTQRLASKGS